MAVTTRQELKEYALRALGAPVLEINVDDDQLEDRIDEALKYWHLYHHEGIEKFYLKQKIRYSRLSITTADAAAFSGAVSTPTGSATVTGEPNSDADEYTVVITGATGTFTAGQLLSSGATGAVLAATNVDGYAGPLLVGEHEKHYIDIPDYVWGVVRVLPFAGVNVSRSLFDLQYQLRLNDLYDLASTSIIYYKSVMSHLALLDLELNGKPMSRFNRLTGKLYIDTAWQSNLAPGDFVVIECYRALDPTQYTKVWDEYWLKHYVTALFKRQWAVNLKKFAGLQLPGGVTLDGPGMYAEAMNEIAILEEDLKTKSAPLEFFMG